MQDTTVMTYNKKPTATALFASLMLIFMTTACSSDDPVTTPLRCPQTAIVHELSRVMEYAESSTEHKDLPAVATMHSISSECRYSDSSLELDLIINIAAIKGQRQNEDDFSVPFFVSVVDTTGKIISKESMTTTFAFASSDLENPAPIMQQEDIHVSIPLTSQTVGEEYRILVGFQLTADQLATNRKIEADRLSQKMKIAK